MPDGKSPEIQALSPADIVEMFVPKIDSLAEGLTSAEQVEAAAQEAVHKAESRLQDKRVELAGAQQGTYRVRQNLRSTVNTGLKALEATGIVSAESFMAQTAIERGSEADAQDFLDRTEELNERLRQPGSRRRLILLGSLPVLNTLGSSSPGWGDEVSFVDLPTPTADDGPIGIGRANGRHYLKIPSQRTSQFTLSLRGQENYGDVFGEERIFYEEPSEIQFVDTEEEFIGLTGGKALDNLPNFLGNNVNIGTGADESLQPAIISGDAVDKFTDWLAQNEFLRTMVVAATAHDPIHERPTVEKLPKGSDARAIAELSFRGTVEDWVNKALAVFDNDDQFIRDAHRDLLLSNEVRSYLGVDDEDLGGYIVDALESTVALDAPSLQFVACHSERPGSLATFTVKSMLSKIVRRLGQADFEVPPLAMNHAVIGLKQKSQDRYLAELGDTRADRKLKRRILEADLV